MTHLMEKIALILCGIDTLEKRCLPVTLAFANVVPSCNFIGTQNAGVVEECAKLNLFIAKDIGVGCPASLILLKKMLEDVIPILSRKVGGVQFNTQAISNCLRVSEVFLCSAVLCAVILFPILHEEAFHLKALLSEQECGDRRINASRHANNDLCRVI